MNRRLQVAEFKEKIAKAQLERIGDIPPPAVALPTALGGTVSAALPFMPPITVQPPTPAPAPAPPHTPAPTPLVQRHSVFKTLCRHSVVIVIRAHRHQSQILNV